MGSGLKSLTETIIDKYYRSESPLRAILTGHSMAVYEMAQKIADSKSLDIPSENIYAAAMLHDIGIYLTDAPSIHCTGTEPYICHGVLGAELLRNEGAPEFLARVCERHTGSGLTVNEILAQELPLPHRDFIPETLLEKLICFADKFFSKGGAASAHNLKQAKPLDKVRTSLARFGSESLERFDLLHALFG